MGRTELHHARDDLPLLLVGVGDILGSPEAHFLGSVGVELDRPAAAEAVAYENSENLQDGRGTGGWPPPKREQTLCNAEGEGGDPSPSSSAPGALPVEV